MPDNAYRQDMVTRIYSYRPTWLELITVSIITVQSIWHNSAADFFGVLENSHRKFTNLVTLPTDLNTKPLVRCNCKLHLVSKRSWKLRPHRSLEWKNFTFMHLPQSATKLTITCGSEFGGLLWLYSTPHRKLQYGCTTRVHRVHN